MNIDGIIFDLDGTLWDSCRIVAESWGHTLRTKYGAQRVPTAAETRSIMGLTVAQIAERLFSGYGERALEICTDCLREENAYISAHGGGTPYPGLEELFGRLSGRCGLYIVSNCIDGYIQCFLGCTGLGGYIKDFECEGVTGMKKADNIALIARRNGLKRYIYVGDTASDDQSSLSDLTLSRCQRCIQIDFCNGSTRQDHCLLGCLFHILMDPGTMLTDIGNLYHIRV